jgi:hypothetical protein
MMSSMLGKSLRLNSAKIKRGGGGGCPLALHHIGLDNGSVPDSNLIYVQHFCVERKLLKLQFSGVDEFMKN